MNTINIKLSSYNIEIAEIVIILQAIKDNPDAEWKDLCSMLGISRSNFYRKIAMLKDDAFKKRLIDNGYTLKQAMAPEILLHETHDSNENQDH